MLVESILCTVLLCLSLSTYFTEIIGKITEQSPLSSVYVLGDFVNPCCGYKIWNIAEAW